MLLPISVDDVKREVEILGTLSGHENVVQFHAAFEDDDLVYIVMEYVSSLSISFASHFACFMLHAFAFCILMTDVPVFLFYCLTVCVRFAINTIYAQCRNAPQGFSGG